MRLRLTKTNVAQLEIKEKSYWVSDETHQNLRLHVGVSGKKTWYVLYRDEKGNKQSYKLGSASVLSPAQAQDMAKDIIARVIRGEDVKKEKPIDNLTYGDFISKYYEPWVEEYRNTGKETVKMLHSNFNFLMRKPIKDISIHEIELWRTKRIHEGKKRATINRNITALKASINWGVEQEKIKENPIAKLKPLSEEDSDKKIRYLSPEERKCLFAALNAREERIRQEYDNRNAFPIGKRSALLPDLRECKFADYLKPMVIVSLHTGIRRGSLFKLLWSNIDFQSGIITIRAAIAKGKKDIYIPMSATLTKTLSAWKKQNRQDGDVLVFSSPKTGKEFDNCKKAWANVLEAANIKNFRWHDMRHDFASRLIMSCHDIYIVSELMGHSDLKMTSRYAHLAPEIKKAAVNMLDEDAVEQELLKL